MHAFEIWLILRRLGLPAPADGSDSEAVRAREGPPSVIVDDGGLVDGVEVRRRELRGQGFAWLNRCAGWEVAWRVGCGVASVGGEQQLLGRGRDSEQWKTSLRGKNAACCVYPLASLQSPSRGTRCSIGFQQHCCFQQSCSSPTRLPVPHPFRLRSHAACHMHMLGHYCIYIHPCHQEKTMQ